VRYVGGERGRYRWWSRLSGGCDPESAAFWLVMQISCLLPLLSVLFVVASLSNFDFGGNVPQRCFVLFSRGERLASCDIEQILTIHHSFGQYAGIT
jgi:hypothetical protein